MKTIVAGCREGIPFATVVQAWNECPWRITGVISGKAECVDTFGEKIAKARGVPVVGEFPVTKQDWQTLGKKAGPLRNRRMLEVAEALLAVWDGRSPGTKDMIGAAREKGIPVHVTMFDARDHTIHRHEWTSERAAILEYDAGYPREIAEVMARVQWAEYQRSREAA